jgi:hypothetical protein
MSDLEREQWEIDNETDNDLEPDDYPSNRPCGYVYTPGSEECDWCDLCEECETLLNA